MRWLADALYLLAGLLYGPVLVYQMLVQRKNRRGWRQRLGGVPRFEPGRQRIWIHAVSVGETNATPRLVEALQAELPGCEVVVSSTTDTGYARAVQLYGSRCVFRYPLDLSWVVGRALRRIQPALIVLMEQEVWYNLTRAAKAAGIPVAVVNGRLTERSAKRLMRLGPAGRAMFGRLAWVGAQDEAIAQRFAQVGVPAERIEVTSSLKWDTAQLGWGVAGSAALARAIGLANDRLVWVCGSTGPGEEAMILSAYRRLRSAWPNVAQNVPGIGRGVRAHPLPALVLVPRKPERFDEVAKLIAGAGFACVRRSACPDGSAGPALPEDAVVLGDTMGELRRFYAGADVVFVGRSLVPMGGSDPMEVAALGRPVVVGPCTDNFALPVSALTGADAIRIVQNPDELAAVVGQVLSQSALAAGLGEQAQATVRAHQGATRRTAKRLQELLIGTRG